MTVTTRALPTAYDPPSGVVTVATPSCCCCCCCCLNALGAGMTVVTSAARAAARGNDRPLLAPTLLGLGALVAAGGVAWLLVVLGVETAGPPVGAAIVTYGVISALALHRAGVPLRTAALVALAFATGTALIATLELFVALLTALLIELAAPLSMWAGWALGRTLLRDDRGDPAPPSGAPVVDQP